MLQAIATAAPIARIASLASFPSFSWFASFASFASFALSAAALSATVSAQTGAASAGSEPRAEPRSEARPVEATLREQDEAAIAYKLTPTIYRVTDQRSAFDVNLRANKGPHIAWIGHYQRGSEFQQTRVGYEHEIEIPNGRIVAGGQYATRGFLGGSATIEWGRPVFGLLGIGRTNLKEYYNLDFDPNDAIRYGIGWRLSEQSTVQLFQVRDDRAQPGNRVTHLSVRTRPASRTRITVDVFHRSGWNYEGDPPQVVRATGLSVTLDYDRYFARLAWDPNVNFTGNDMVRFALGMRF